MMNMHTWSADRGHHSIILDASQNGFDKGAAAMGSILLTDEDPDRLFLFYTGASDIYWSRSAIGLATSKNMLEFRRNGGNPILEGSKDPFFHKCILNPAVIRVNNRFYMIFSGESAPKSSRKLGIAYADDPEGPWRIMGELIKPSFLWEGNAIDNGSSILKLDDETILLYYSSITSPKIYDISTLLRRYPIRRIGILKVRIRGTSLSRIEAMRFSGNPLKLSKA